MRIQSFTPRSQDLQWIVEEVKYSDDVIVELSQFKGPIPVVISQLVQAQVSVDQGGTYRTLTPVPFVVGGHWRGHGEEGGGEGTLRFAP